MCSTPCGVIDEVIAPLQLLKITQVKNRKIKDLAERFVASRFKEAKNVEVAS